MPGISCPRPAMISTEPESMFVGNFCIGSPWEPRNSSNFQHPAAGRVPLLPVRHKSCRPSNIQAPWLNSKLNKMTNDGVVVANQVFISSNDSENDLAAMVRDFIEGNDGYDSSDKESPTYTAFTLFFEKLKGLLNSTSFVERELRSNVIRSLFLISEDRMVCHGGNSCNGRCIRSIIVKRLRAAGYDAAICITRWIHAGKVPGGEYEYIDVSIGDKERYIVDLDFQSHFEIARPVANYITSLNLLPTVFIGSSRKLRKVLEAMSDAAKSSLKQNSMHLPPWRTLEYLKAKWFSPLERVTDCTDSGISGVCTSSTGSTSITITGTETSTGTDSSTNTSTKTSTSTSPTSSSTSSSTTTKSSSTKSWMKAPFVEATRPGKTGSRITKTGSTGIHRMDALARLQQEKKGCYLQLKRLKACLLVEDKRDVSRDV